MNIYINLTQEFNKGKVRAIISSGQAVVLHRLAIVSKDGDWIIREEEEATSHILNSLTNYNTKYRFGAPLDIRWLKGGWSSHLEFQNENLRVRTDFVSRPARISEAELKKLWKDQESKNNPFVDPINLANIKKTQREKDYPIIGELARLMQAPESQFLYSRSARDLFKLSKENPDLLNKLLSKRPLLKDCSNGVEAIEIALDAERRTMIKEDALRMQKYFKASEDWRQQWSNIEKKIISLNLLDTHNILVEQALNYLPFAVD